MCLPAEIGDIIIVNIQRQLKKPFYDIIKFHFMGHVPVFENHHFAPLSLTVHDIY